MIIETDNFIVEVKGNINHLNKMLESLNNKLNEILNFFNLDKLCNKNKIVIWNDLDEYKKHINHFVNDGNIDVLVIGEYSEIKGHIGRTTDDFINNITHVFVHIYHREKQKDIMQSNYYVLSDGYNDQWFHESLATNLGNPQNFSLCELNITKNDLMYFNELENNYNIAYTLGNYILNNLRKDEILRYIKYPERLIADTENILESAKNYYGFNTKNKIGVNNGKNR